jgi:hypothetical protein
VTHSFRPGPWQDKLVGASGHLGPAGPVWGRAPIRYKRTGVPFVAYERGAGMAPPYRNRGTDAMAISMTSDPLSTLA